MPPETLVVTPEGWLSRGEAFVRGEGEQLAVFGGIPGESIRAQVFGRQHQQVRARAVAPAGQAHPTRQKPSCPKWGPCGGCPWMHVRPGGQKNAHDVLWAAAFDEVGLKPETLPPLAAVVRGAELLSEVRVEWGISDRGQPRLGVPAREGNGLVAIPECEKVTPLLRTFMGACVGSLLASGVPAERGPIRGLRARQVGDELFVTVHTARFAPKLADWALSLAKHLPAVSGVVAEFPPGEDPKGLGIQRLYGHDGLDTTLAGVCIRLGVEENLPRDLQGYANLLTEAAEMLGVLPGDAVLDVGAHIGVRSVVLARVAGWALAIESGEVTHRRAAENVLSNRAPVEFIHDSWPDALATAQPRLVGRRPLVWVDTGRKEMGQRVVDGIVALDPRRVALQGSNPHALAREIVRWGRLGFSLAALRRYAIDPHTPFVEAVAVLHAANQAAPEMRAPRRRAVR